MSARQWRLPPVTTGSLRLSIPVVLVFICGAAAPVIMNIVGEIYVSELLLPIVALVVLFSAGGDRSLREPVFAALFYASLVTLTGYVVSDLLQGTRPDQFLRGWGRIGLIISDFIAMAVIFGQDRRHLWWYVLGNGLGSILFLRFIAHAPIALWKFGYADPMLEVSAVLSTFLPLAMSSAWIGLIGVYSMFTDFRSFAGICLAIAAFLWLRSGWSARRGNGSISRIKLALVGAVVVVVLVLTLSLTGGSGTGRRNQSDAGRRAAFETGVEAVTRSPLVGYGSWAESKELTSMYLKRAQELRGENGSTMQGQKVIFNPHSQILHAWFEGGILGTAFLVTILIQLLKQGRWLLAKRPIDALTPLLLYFALSTLWDLFMSPFTAPHRLGIGMGAAIVVLLRMEQRSATRWKAGAVAALARTPVKEVASPALGRRAAKEVRYAQRRLNWKQRRNAAPSQRAIFR
jgi:O-antigen ligase